MGVAVAMAAVPAAVGGVACGKETGPEAAAAAAPGPVDAAEVPACSKPCTSTAECACGRDRASGQCAVGRAECIDTSNPCPDFCAGIDGRCSTACIDGACTTTRSR
jgi:hypothetical protein